MIVSAYMEMLRKVVGVITLVVVLLFLWFAYSLIRFDGFFHPLYTFGLSDPYGYYQQHVGSKLMEYGEEYKISETETSKWNVYHESGRGFEFKYPQDFVLVRTVENESSDRITFSVDTVSRTAGCTITVEWRGWKLGKHGLPSKRKITDFFVRNKKQSELQFIRDQYGGATQVRSTRFSDGQQRDIQFTGVTFIHKESDQFLHFVDYNNTCDEAVMQGMLATFRFVE